jgi:hypothetical protein
MRITKAHLQQLIREEISTVIFETGAGDGQVDASDAATLKSIAADIEGSQVGVVDHLKSLFDEIVDSVGGARLSDADRVEIRKAIGARRRWDSEEGSEADDAIIWDWYSSPSFITIFGWFLDSGDMPYEVAKARGDVMPDEWILDRLIQVEDTGDY